MWILHESILKEYYEEYDVLDSCTRIIVCEEEVKEKEDVRR